MDSMITECRKKLTNHNKKNQASIVYFANKQQTVLDRAINEIGQE
jgi:hypothetical protein